MSQQAGSTEGVKLPYRDAPTGAVAASEAALKALARSRLWALVLGIGLLVYAGLGLIAGTAWGIVLLTKAGQPGYSVWEFTVLTTVNLVLAPISLVGGVLVIRYHSAARRACADRNSDDLERALIRQLHVWRWACVLLAAVFTLPLSILFVAALKDVWP